MKTLEKKFKKTINGRTDFYTERYTFKRDGERLVIEQFSMDKYSMKKLSIRVFADDENGRNKANEVYKRLKSNGYQIAC